MVTPRVSFVATERLSALHDRINQHVADLVEIAPEMLACHVSVLRRPAEADCPGSFMVHVHVTLPGTEFDISPATLWDASDLNPYAAAHEAFEAMRHRLSDYRERRYGKHVRLA